jgi:hypothetical protein
MNDPYHVYMDLDVVNNDYNSIDRPHLRFEETRNTPFLPGDSADYFCSIVRFNIQTGNTLPVFIPKIQTGQADPNRTIYNITFQAQAGSSVATGSANVIYEPEDLSAPIPVSPQYKQDIATTYYYVYNYQHFVSLVNKALTEAWGNFKLDYVSKTNATTQTPWGDSQWEEIVIPYFIFDVSTNRVVLYVDKVVFDMTNGLTDIVKLHFNDRLYELFASLPSRLISTNGFKYYRINVIDRYFDRATQRDDQTKQKREVLQIQQEMNSIALWNPVSSIVFASSLLPIVPTQTSAPKDLGSNNLVSGGNNSNLLPVLSDFSIAVDANNQYRPMVEYNPGAEYRLIDMNSTMNLNRIDIIVYWKDRSGDLHPFQLQPGCAASVKLMFRRKDFNVFQ